VADKVKALEREVREPRQANEILRKASIFRAGGARPPETTSRRRHGKIVNEEYFARPLIVKSCSD
jgi:transposase-like protein